MDLDKAKLIEIARDLLDRLYEAEYANLEQGLCFRGLTYTQLRREKAAYTRMIDKIAKRKYK